MDEHRLHVRPYRETDAAALAALCTAVHPEHPVSVASIAQWTQVDQRDGRRMPRWLVEERETGEIVATGGLLRNPFADAPDRPDLYVEVLPTRRRRGIGAHLFDHVLAAARAEGARGLRAAFRTEPPGGLEFALARGFREVRRSWISQLEPATVDTSERPALVARLARDGIGLTTLEEEGPEDASVRHRLHDLDVVAGADVPRAGSFTPISFEDFQRLQLTGPGFLPAAWALAKVGDRYVGMSTALREVADPATLYQGFTGTRPEYRGRGVARALKLAVIEYARREGYRRIETTNDSTNERMWGLNRALGFRKISERVYTERDL